MDSREDPGLNELLFKVWPYADVGDIQVAKISHRRNAEHWRARHAGDAIVARRTTRSGSGRRIIAALTALEEEPFAPALRAHTTDDDGAFLVAMADLGDIEPTPSDIQTRLAEFVGCIGQLHAHDRFRDAVAACGRSATEDSSLGWAEEEWEALQRLAPSDERLIPAQRWLAAARDSVSRASDAHSIMVHGHGDLHSANWRLTPEGPAMIDWEEIRRWPLASELADFVVFGRLDAAEVTRLYGAPESYVSSVRGEAAVCALSFYLHWLRTLLDGTDPRAESFEGVRAVCLELFNN
jgi:hypothetical protein